MLAVSWLIWLGHQFYPAEVMIPWTVTNAYYFPVAAWQVIFVTALVVGFYRERVSATLRRVPIPPGWHLLARGGDAGADPAGARSRATGGLAGGRPAGRRSLLRGVRQAVRRIRAAGRDRRLMAGFAYSLVTVFWVPIRRALGWLLLAAGHEFVAGVRRAPDCHRRRLQHRLRLRGCTIGRGPATPSFRS